MQYSMSGFVLILESNGDIDIRLRRVFHASKEISIGPIIFVLTVGINLYFYLHIIIYITNADVGSIYIM